MFILNEQSTGEAEKPVALPSDRVYYEHQGVEDYDGTITLLLGGYFRNTAVPKNGDYTVLVDLVDRVQPYRIAILNSQGQIVSETYAAKGRDVEKIQQTLLKKAKRSIFGGVPYRGKAMQGAAISLMYSDGLPANPNQNPSA